MQVHIDGIGVWGAGLADWPRARAVLKGEESFVPAQMPLPAPALLPPAERRRSPATARIAVQVAAEACAMAGADPATLPSVFASSHGDTEITDYLCRELASKAPLSPTKFHNSVHNAPSGYWTIAVGCMHSANAISAGNESFSAGLLEAMSQALAGNARVLLVAYDLAAPAPLSSVCPVALTFGVALVLNPAASARSLARLTLVRGRKGRAPACVMPESIAALIRGNPAARALPLLSLLARGEAAATELSPCCWELTPCP